MSAKKKTAKKKVETFRDTSITTMEGEIESPRSYIIIWEGGPSTGIERYFPKRKDAVEMALRMISCAESILRSESR